MSDSITIVGKKIRTSEADWDISELKFLQDNPRVFLALEGEPDFESLSDEQKQGRIYTKLLKESSVKNLKADIEKNGGLMEPILVRNDTREVVEGNSRLAVYRELYEQYQDEKWEKIKCKVVASLTDKQQATYLNQIHVKGKTDWSAYEKANFAYNLSQKYSPNEVAEISGESLREVNQRIKVIKMMKKNGDTDRSHFSYYDVMVRNQVISKATLEYLQLKEFLLKEIKAIEENKISGSGNNFPTAKDFREKMPVIIKNAEVREELIKGEYDFDKAYNMAKVSGTEEKIKIALSYLEKIEKVNIILEEYVNKGSLNKIEASIRKLEREVDRLKRIVHEIKKP